MTRIEQANALRDAARQYSGTDAAALNEAANRVAAGMPIPRDIAEICQRALAFKQDRYGK